MKLLYPFLKRIILLDYIRKIMKMILKTAEKMGYQPDLLARSLVKGVSMTIGVIVVGGNYR